MGYKYTCDERLFEPHKLTPERAYIVGVAWADGYLGKQGLRITLEAREAPPFRAGRDRAAREACHVVAFRMITRKMWSYLLFCA